MVSKGTATRIAALTLLLGAFGTGYISSIPKPQRSALEYVADPAYDCIRAPEARVIQPNPIDPRVPTIEKFFADYFDPEWLTTEAFFREASSQIAGNGVHKGLAKLFDDLPANYISTNEGEKIWKSDSDFRFRCLGGERDIWIGPWGMRFTYECKPNTYDFSVEIPKKEEKVVLSYSVATDKAGDEAKLRSFSAKMSIVKQNSQEGFMCYTIPQEDKELTSLPLLTFFHLSSGKKDRLEEIKPSTHITEEEGKRMAKSLSDISLLRFWR